VEQDAMRERSTPPARLRRRKSIVALLVTAASATMLGLSFAAVPLYRLLCSTTGFGGTPQIAKTASSARGERDLTISFDANVAPGLTWEFAPEKPQIRLRTGIAASVSYKATNFSDRETSARATFNVSPDSAGGYFNKVACFCFDEQTLGPGETREMTVVFYLDPALEKDPALEGVQMITLSYTFFAVKKPGRENTAAVGEFKRRRWPP
jgi:cytochrome c oxidase assembly protein subunit 11